MAFGGRELRLLLSIQSYGTTNISRLRRDILSLNAATRAANMNQLGVQTQMLRKAEQLTKVRDRIAAIEAATAAKTIATQARLAASQDKFAAKRARAAGAELALANTIAAKRLQIGKTEDRLNTMRGSQAAQFGVREARLATQRLQLGNQLAMIPAKQLGIESSILNNKATLLNRERQLVKLAGAKAAAELMAGKNLGNYGSRVKEVALRYRASVKSAERLAQVQAAIPREVALLQSQLTGLAKQEQLITAQKLEQAAAVGRQVELLALQNAQLTAIEAKEAEIAAAIALIDREEAAVNAELAEQLALLERESIVLQRLKVQAGEYAAEMNLAATAGMRNAAAMDSAIARQNKLMHMEARARTIQHAGRTAQFGGLIGTAIAATTAASFAGFNEQAVLAATQTRKFGQGADVIAKNADLITNGVDTASGEIEGILGLMQQFPATGDEMATAAYDIFSSMQKASGGVLDVGEGLKLLAKFNELAVATSTDLSTATNAGITVLNNFGQEASQTDTALNLMVATVRFGRMHLEDFNAMLDKVAPAAAAAGMNLGDVAGAMALITTRQPSQRMSATGIARLLQTFRDPDFQRGAAKFGANLTEAADGTGKLKPLPKIMEEMAKAFGLFEEQGGPQQLFKELTATGRGSGIGRQSRIEAANAYTFLMANMEDYRLLQKLVTGDTDEFAKALEAMSDSPGVKWKVFINQMRAFVLVIGQAALPALLKITDVLVSAAQWFGRLSQETRETIVRWGVIVSIGALVVGTFGNIAAGIIAMIANFRIMRIETMLTATALDTASKKAGLMSVALRGIAGMGMIAIPIIVQAMMGGDPGAWGLAMAALQGAAGGAMIGSMFAPGVGTLIGAGVGALTVPIVVSIIADIQGSKDPVKRAYDNYLKQLDNMRDKDGGFWSAIDPRTLLKGIPGAVSFEEWQKKHPKLVAKLTATTKDGTEKQSKLMQEYNAMLKRLNKETAGEYASQVEELEKAWRAQDTNLSAGQQRAAQMAEARARAVETAMDNMNQKIDTAVGNMTQIFEKFEQVNKAAFSIFAGPTMQGMLGQVFGSLNDMLRQFGVVIPVPFKILQQDMNQQLAFFKRWRQGLNKLLARGAPLELVQEIQALGPTATPMIEGLLGASPKQFRGYVKDFKTGSKLIQKAAQNDMNNQIKDWNKHGKNVAWAIISGLASTPAQAKLREGFKTYVVKTFGGVLREEMATEIAEAMVEAAAQIDAATVTAVAGATGGAGGGNTGGKLTPKQRQAAMDAANFAKPINKLTLKEANRQIMLGQARVRHMEEGGITPKEQQRIRAEVARLNKLMIRREALRKQQAAARGRASAIARARQGDMMAPGSVTVNEGDKVVIHADGASPTKVQQALNKRAFQKKNKRRNR